MRTLLPLAWCEMFGYSVKRSGEVLFYDSKEGTILTNIITANSLQVLSYIRDLEADGLVYLKTNSSITRMSWTIFRLFWSVLKFSPSSSSGNTRNRNLESISSRCHFQFPVTQPATHLPWLPANRTAQQQTSKTGATNHKRWLLSTPHCGISLLEPEAESIFSVRHSPSPFSSRASNQFWVSLTISGN